MIGHRREPHFRGIEVLLECAHIVTLPTVHFKVTPALAAAILDQYVRRGAWCPTCKTFYRPVQTLGTCRIDHPQETRT